MNYSFVLFVYAASSSFSCSPPSPRRNRRRHRRRRRTAAILYYRHAMRCRPFPRLFLSSIRITLSIVSRVCRVPLGGHPSARACVYLSHHRRHRRHRCRCLQPFSAASVQQYIISLHSVTRCHRGGCTGCYTNLSTRLYCVSEVGEI